MFCDLLPGIVVYAPRAWVKQILTHGSPAPPAPFKGRWMLFAIGVPICGQAVLSGIA